jgi:hypothetical protein
VAKLMAIGRADRCAECGTDLPAGTNAYWLRDQRVVVCTGCQSNAAEQVETAAPSRGPGSAPPVDPPLPPSPTISADPADESDIAGGSAQRQYDKRSERELARKQKRVADDAEWRTSIKAQRPVLGRIVTAVAPKPQVGPESQSTKAWKTGAEGERRVAEVLADASDIEVLHDRLVPGKGGANIDHIVVGPSGVFVVDAKKYSGRIEVRDVGGMFQTDFRLYVAGRDHTKTVDAVLGQVEVVRTALADDFAAVPVRGVLCFIGCDWGLRMKTKELKGVTALWPVALRDHVAADGWMAERVNAVAEHLRGRLRAAPAR